MDNESSDMRCGYIILTFVLGCILASPAVLAARAFTMGFSDPGLMRYAELTGVGELIAISIVLGWHLIGAIATITIKAEAELKALMAGLRGKNAP